LVKQFVAKGYTIDFICCLRGEHFYTLPITVSVYEPSFERTASVFNKLIYYPRLLLYIRKQVEKIKPDKVLVFGDLFSPVTLLALYGTKYPIYISDRTIPDYKFKFPIPQLKKWLYPKSMGFIAQTKLASDYKKNVFGNALKIKVIPNALPEMKFSVNDAKEKVILYVGRFAWEKDPKILIEAMSFVILKHPDWTLKMAGLGPLLNDVKDLVRAKELDSNVIFLGNVTNIESLYQSASVFVLPSVVEGFPNALIEAMSAGLPSICFSDIPYEDIVDNNQNGFVIQSRSPQKLAEKVIKLIESKSLRSKVGIKALKIRKILAAEKVANEYLKFMKVK
jgi:glycosyltransferase involved in cell wall biosynthesis